MVRATRSTQLALDDPPTPQAAAAILPARKAQTKKRKRTSENEDLPQLEQDQQHSSETDKDGHVTAGGESDREEDDDRPLGKRQKTKQVVKDEDMEYHTPPSPKHKDSGEGTLSLADAENLLVVLEAVDLQGLLDRDLHLSHWQLPSTFRNGQLALSLRLILREPSSFTLRVVQNAIRALAGESPAPRTPVTRNALEQSQFCDLAARLLQQIATRHEGALDVSRDSIGADTDEGDKMLIDGDEKLDRFTLHQHLPTGDFFTSAAKLSATEAASLVTGQASLVALQPSAPLDPIYLPKLGSYSRPLKQTLVAPNRLPISQRTATGSILDYGPFASFAPIYDSEAGEITQEEIHDIIWSKRQRLLARRKLAESLESDVEMGLVVEGTTSAAEAIDPTLGLEDDLRAAMQQLQLETGISDLLEKNALAMQKLVALQNARLRLGDKAPPPQVNGEEWKLAHALQDSLTSLALLRPRRVGIPEAPLVPPPAILRALHQTLGTDPTPGWKGTLSRERDMAYRDNTTITPGMTPYFTQAVTQNAASRPAPVASTPSYSSVPTYPQQYQRPAFAGTTSSYYSSGAYYSYGQSPSTGAKPQMPPSQYYNSAYPYPHYMQPQYAAYGGQPAYGQQAAYGQQSMYSQPQSPATPNPQQSRAIPNLAKPAMPYANGWGTPATGGAALPPHMRKTGATAPVTPGAPGMGYGTPNAASASPVYPPGMQTPQYGTPYSGWPAQKA
ncbi:hypothetical protein FRB90_012549 [Tulasnella sp. 427]|nr:hypothetical protein FRB90_012549 [Tulasnella sp. 427]